MFWYEEWLEETGQEASEEAYYAYLGYVEGCERNRGQDNESEK